MTRRDTPSRHGRAADALIATYVRELVRPDGTASRRSVAHEEPDAVPASDARLVAESLAPVAGAPPAGAAAVDATL